MMQLLEQRKTQGDDNAVYHELRIRIWLALLAADNWCSSSLGFPREMKDWSRPARLPMDENLFADMDPDEPLIDQNEPCKSPGLWAHMATLIEVFSPIQELNWRVANCEGLHPDQIEQDTDHLARLLDDWQNRLPHDVQLTESNLIEHSERGTGGIFMGLHLGFHHYATLLFYQYLDTRNMLSMRARQFAARCKHHALSYSSWLARGRRQPGCEAVYPTVGHMAIVSSSVILHTLLFGEENELPRSRHCLEANFEALLELEEYWPIVKPMVNFLPFPREIEWPSFVRLRSLSADNLPKINRLMHFQNNCLLLSHYNQTHRLDRWMVRFLFEYALPLETKAIDPHTAWEMEIISAQAHIFSEKGRLPAFGAS
ncbi:hypothetical protein N7510_006641 [Penicillium lagena]|uniref:uncharacterized protein n=1 Tax=Penicillium lagena TaxID=94218 RepID=UPI0025411177|nr:uncharacterized protein N7510_006641 [Penicillium lagena]KAJ5613447.1 hypothetical protein N7510_006641 [Penicillium lagena]